MDVFGKEKKNGKRKKQSSDGEIIDADDSILLSRVSFESINSEGETDIAGTVAIMTRLGLEHDKSVSTGSEGTDGVETLWSESIA